MNEPTRFGEYLLFKKLSEDPLGATYRAGVVADQAVKQIVLLRVLSAQNIDAESLLASMQGHTAESTLQGPGLTPCLAVGQVSGVPYAAYEYAPGRDLATLINAANSGFSSLNMDYAVLIAERIAKGLAIVHQSETERARPYHGFLVPQLVILTHEGETLLTGFELGPAMARRVASGFAPALHPYLGPEVLAGQTPDAKTDIYSLGAIFFELLTGAPLVVGQNLHAQIASARLTEDGSSALPAGLMTLLDQSLAPAETRVPRADLWHRQLSNWMAESKLAATNFDLAFYVNELFREDIRRDKREVAEEKHLDLTPRPAEPPPTATLPVTTPPVATLPQPAMTLETATAANESTSAGSRTGLFIGLAVVAVLLLGGIAYVVSRGKAELAASEPATAPQTSAVAQTTEPTSVDKAQEPRGAAIDLEAAAAELDRLIQERAEDMEARLAAEYDEQIQSLKQQVEDAREVEEEALQAVAGGAELAPSTAPAAPSRTERTAEKTGSEADAARQPKTEVADVGETPLPGSTQAPATAAAEETTAAVATAKNTAPPPPAAEANTALSSQQQQPAVTAPKLLRLPEPTYPPQARALNRQTTVVVKVLVNAQGKVDRAEPVSKKEAGFGFDQAALRAASKATFTPATRGGQPTEMWTSVVVTFKLK